MTYPYEPDTVIFDHAVRTPEELCFAIIAEAEHHGYDPNMGGQLTDFSIHRYDPEILDEITYEAIEYLNDHVAPYGTYFDNNGEVGAFGLWKIDEDPI